MKYIILNYKKFLYKVLPFTLCFILCFFSLSFESKAAGINTVVSTPALYVGETVSVYDMDHYFNCGQNMRSDKLYKVRLDFNYTIAAQNANSSFWSQFTLLYNGSVYYPMYQIPGRVVFDFIVYGGETGEFSLRSSLHYNSNTVNSATNIYTISISTSDFSITECESGSIVGELNENNELMQQQTNELTNGYESSNMGDAENKFNDSASDLTGIEDTLSDSSTQYVDTFTSTGFDDSLLDNIAPSMQYVVTWFTNFWNMGGALTKCFTLCFALYIAFYILRVRS